MKTSDYGTSDMLSAKFNMMMNHSYCKDGKDKVTSHGKDVSMV